MTKASGARPLTALIALPIVLAAILLGSAVVGPVTPARADDVSQIAAGLRTGRLHVTSEAQGALDPAARARVGQALDAASKADVRIVVGRAGLNGRQVGMLLEAVEQRVGEGRTYYGVSGDNIAGISKEFSGAELNRLISQATEGDLGTRLVRLTQVTDQEARQQADSGRRSGFVALGVMFVIVLCVIGLGLVVVRRRRGREARQMAELREGVQEDVTRLGEDIMALDLKVTDPALDPVIRDDYTRALDAYDTAKAATDAAGRPEDMSKVTTALEDGRYSMMAVRARLAGEPVPERRPPCFFNPQHGPSVRDVAWAPPGGLARSVPACALDAQAVLTGLEPDSRLVPAGGRRVPYWQAGPAYAPYAGGYYSGHGGTDMLGGMLLGTALGSMMFGGLGGGLGAPGGLGGDAGDSGGFAGEGGDIGGGWDFGSGDFGGGGGDSGGGGF